MTPLVINEVPKPGDVLIARCPMRSWQTMTTRGDVGTEVKVGEKALVVQAWQVSKRVRLVVIVRDELAMFSHALHCVCMNWERLHP